MKIDSWFTDFFEHIQQHWLRYTALLVTAGLTGFTAWTYTASLFYVIALIVLAEGAVVFWSLRVEDYGNLTQKFCAILGTALAWIAIAATNLASATILASISQIEVFTAFQSVPEWAQRIVVFVVPVLGVFHGIIATFHHFSSEISKMHRAVGGKRREARMEIEQAKANAQVSIAQEEAARFAQLAAERSRAIGIKRGEKRWDTTSRKEYGDAAGFAEPPTQVTVSTPNLISMEPKGGELDLSAKDTSPEKRSFAYGGVGTDIKKKRGRKARRGRRARKVVTATPITTDQPKPRRGRPPKIQIVEPTETPPAEPSWPEIIPTEPRVEAPSPSEPDFP